MNPYDTKQLKRLKGALEHSYNRVLLPFREKRLDIIRQYVGQHYGENGAKEDLPLNLLAQAVIIYLRNLFSRSPRVLVSTPHAELKWRGANFELALNSVLSRIRFKRHFDDGIRNAMFGLGVYKVGLTASEQVTEIDGEKHNLGQPYCRAVDLDDWVHDSCARAWDECSYLGNRYRMPLETALEYEMFDKKERERLSPTRRRGHEGDERVDELSRGESQDKDEYTDYVELWDLYLPRENLMVTLPFDGPDNAKPLRVMEYEGPEGGPFHILSYLDVPNNLMPVAPTAHWLDQHCLVNSLLRKLAYQAERQMEVYGVMGGGEKDAERLIKAKDGQMVKMDDPKNVVALKYGGADQATLLFMNQMKESFSWNAGNLEAIGGLGVQADTLGQERLMKQSASVQLAEMQDRTMECARAVVRAIGWWIWNDKIQDYPIEVPLPDGSMAGAMFGPDDRDGYYNDYNLDIDPYSLQDTSPGEKLARLNEFTQTQVLPLLPFAQQQGFDYDIEKHMRYWAKYSGMEELTDLFQFMRPPQPIAPGATELQHPGKPPVTKRIEERRTVPGQTQKSSSVLMGKMMAGTANEQEMGAAM